METDQAKFEGFAKVEVMGHQSHIGMVSTQAFGAAVLFRIDSPGIPECEETLDRAQWVGEVYAQPGSIVKRPEIPASTVLVGAGSIYRIIPCEEAVAMKAIRASQQRPLIPVRLVGRPQITAASVAAEQVPDFEFEDVEEEEDDEIPA